MVDYQMMTRNVRGFMSLFHCDKPVVCKVHGFCVAGGTDMALCSDLLVIEDDAKIGYPPARVWGVPTTALWAHRIGLEKAKRLLFTGDCLSGREAVEWGLATECAPRAELDERFEIAARADRADADQPAGDDEAAASTRRVYAQGLARRRRCSARCSTASPATRREGYAFQRARPRRASSEAVRERDEPFGDLGAKTSGVVKK